MHVIQLPMIFTNPVAPKYFVLIGNYKHVHMHTHTYTYTCVRTHAHAHTHTHTHTHIHIHMHAQSYNYYINLLCQDKNLHCSLSTGLNFVSV